MRNILRLLLAIALACPSAAATAATPGRFIQYPDISGSTIVFNWEHDLWTVPAGGGVATRLTNHPGGENVPKFSPDGKQIVFAGQYRRPEPVCDPRDGRRSNAGHLHGRRPAGGGLDTRRLADRLPVGA